MRSMLEMIGRLFRSHSDNRKSKTCTEPFDSAQDKLRRSIQNLYGAMPKYRKLVGTFVIVLTFVFGGVEASAQQPKKIPRVGFLAQRISPTPTTPHVFAHAFRQGLRDLGYIEGKNILVDYRYGEGKLDSIPSQVAELVQLKVDVLVLRSLSSIRAAKQATQTIPIVMV